MEFEQIIILLVSGLYGAIIMLVVMWMRMVKMIKKENRDSKSIIVKQDEDRFEECIPGESDETETVHEINSSVKSTWEKDSNFVSPLNTVIQPIGSISNQSNVTKPEASPFSFTEFATSKAGFNFKLSKDEFGTPIHFDTSNNGALFNTSLKGNENFNTMPNNGQSSERRKLRQTKVNPTNKMVSKFCSQKQSSFSFNKSTSPLTFGQPNFESHKRIKNIIREINDLDELVVPSRSHTRFHRDLSAEEFKKWCSDEKFLLMGPSQEVLRHEKMLFVIVQDFMPNIPFLKKYGSQVEHLRIYCQSVNSIQPSIYAQISENCSENLKEIEFYDLEGDEINSFTKEFTKIERVQFKSGKIGPNITEAFRRNFSNVQKLEFGHKLTTINDRDIINEEYCNLKEFEASYDESGTNFNESDIERALNLSKEHLQKITLWGLCTPTFLCSFSDTKFPKLKKMSIKNVHECVIANPPNGDPFVFKHLNEFEMSTICENLDLSCPFDFGHLQKIILDLPFLPDSWIDDFIAKNQQVHYLSLRITSIGISNGMVLKIKKALPNLRYFEIGNALNVWSPTITELLLENNRLSDLMFCNFGEITYLTLRNYSKKINALGWSLMLFPKFNGAKFERNKEKKTPPNTNVSDVVKIKFEKIKAAKLCKWYESQMKNRIESDQDLKEKDLTKTTPFETLVPSFEETTKNISINCNFESPHHVFKYGCSENVPIFISANKPAFGLVSSSVIKRPTISPFYKSKKSITEFGTSTVKYQPTDVEAYIDIDGKTMNPTIHCIAAMTEYQEKSINELRLEDYKNNIVKSVCIGTLNRTFMQWINFEQRY